MQTNLFNQRNDTDVSMASPPASPASFSPVPLAERAPPARSQQSPVGNRPPTSKKTPKCLSVATVSQAATAAGTSLTPQLWRPLHTLCRAFHNSWAGALTGRVNHKQASKQVITAVTSDKLIPVSDESVAVFGLLILSIRAGTAWRDVVRDMRLAHKEHRRAHLREDSDNWDSNTSESSSSDSESSDSTTSSISAFSDTDSPDQHHRYSPSPRKRPSTQHAELLSAAAGMQARGSRDPPPPNYMEFMQESSNSPGTQARGSSDPPPASSPILALESSTSPTKRKLQPDAASSGASSRKSWRERKVEKFIKRCRPKRKTAKRAQQQSDATSPSPSHLDVQSEAPTSSPASHMHPLRSQASTPAVMENQQHHLDAATRQQKTHRPASQPDVDSDTEI